jgi:carbonic anhydrase/acetyltransferase-like protein (isoleucine patch superfamily)
MNAVIMDDAVVGEGAIIGALCFVPTEMEIPDRKIAVGNPAKIVKDVSNEMLEWKTLGTELYNSLPAESQETLRSLSMEDVSSEQSITESDPYDGKQGEVIKTWKKTK